MGLLTPGVQYTYEYKRGIVYACESGKEPFIIGWKYVPINIASTPVEIDEW